MSPVSPALAGRFFTRVTWEAQFVFLVCFFFFAILTIKKNTCSKNPVVKITGLTKIKRDRPFKPDANLYPEINKASNNYKLKIRSTVRNK